MNTVLVVNTTIGFSENLFLVFKLVPCMNFIYHNFIHISYLFTTDILVHIYIE